MIIFENEKFMVVNKPAGTLSQPDRSGHQDLAAQIKEQRQKSAKPLPFLAPVHRLDRNTSGLILLAKSPEAAKQLTELLQTGKIHRTYLALVKGFPGQSGTLDFPLRKDEKKNQVFVDQKGEPAITHFQTLQKLGNSSLVQVRLETGRSHQIRAHFAHAGHALVGDPKYAKKPWTEIFHRPALHAVEIQIEGFTPGVWRAPLPEDFSQLLRKLGGDPAGIP